ncbi:hypothetical protein XFF6970_290077 [Xanthomonas citri pv. fuscans]|nr:hypothetical protein XFF6970_290077 [Xanthomonas citri pv. fuscans]
MFEEAGRAGVHEKQSTAPRLKC